MRGISGDQAKLWLVIAMLAGCGGRSTQSGDLDSGGSAASGSGSSGRSSSGGSSSSNGAGPSIGARGGFGGGPSQQSIVDACNAVCDKGERSACRGFEHDDCIESCALSSAKVVDTAACATVTIEYIYCVDDLPDVCAVLADDPISTRCDEGAFNVGACIQAHCDRDPLPIDCKIAD